MTNNNHPITPPPELVEQWECEYHHMTYGPDFSMFISEKAARWGADQELEACCEWLKSEGHEYEHEALFAARRPKLLSLKQQALQELDKVDMLWATEEFGKETLNSLDTIRKALEALPDD